MGQIQALRPYYQCSRSPCTVPRLLPCSLSSVWDFSPSQPVPYLCLGQGWLQRGEQQAAWVCWAPESAECFPCQKVSRHPPNPPGDRGRLLSGANSAWKDLHQ